MPTNLPPEYYEVEKRYRSAKTTEEKISLLEEMMSTIPKHKGTDKLRADLRRRMAKLKDTAESKKQAGSRHTSLFYVEKEGDGRVVFIGPPNTGRSSLLSALTNAEPKISESPYTTWAPAPGMLDYQKVQIQLIDTPPMSREHTEPELFDLIRTADLLLAVVNLKSDPFQQLQEIVEILLQHNIAPQCATDRYQTTPQTLILPFILAVNKTDGNELEEDFRIFCELLEEEWPVVGVSAQTGYHLEQLKAAIFKALEIIRVYSKPPGDDPDLNAPFVLKRGSTLEEFAAKVHKDFAEKLKTARVWGSDVFDGQMVGRDHLLHDEDVVELHM